MIRRFTAAEGDHEKARQVPVDPQSLANDFYDYSRVVVKKPWGYEYLLFANEQVAVWVLYLRHQAMTSMHCHPSKKTSLVVIEGDVTCSGLESRMQLSSGDAVLIDRGAFHRTQARSERGAYVMEIETPVNKRDLIRLEDQYGRTGTGYEDASQHSFKTQNYNYISFGNQDIPHNFKKRFGHCSLRILRITARERLEEVYALDSDDIVVVLNGSLLAKEGAQCLAPGDTSTVAILRDLHPIEVVGSAELLVIKKADRSMKVSDFVADFLNRRRLKTVFVVPGEANVHLLDSIGRHEELEYLTLQEEKSASMAVEAFANARSEPGVLVLSGGSAAGAVPGVANAWVDSVPMIVLSGQAFASGEVNSSGSRQIGNKSIDLAELVRPITKYQAKITDPHLIQFHLEKALHLSREGRPGPVWLDLSIDVQGMTVALDELREYDPLHSIRIDSAALSAGELAARVETIAEMLAAAERPVILIGNGVRLAGAEKELEELLSRFRLPFVTGWRSADLISDEHPCFFGRPGTYGQRSANFVIQNCDLLLSIGSRLSTQLTGRNSRSFARAARKVAVDVDAAELAKPAVMLDLTVCCDARHFLEEFLKRTKSRELRFESWLKRCEGWKRQFPSAEYLAESLGSPTPPELEKSIYPLPFVRALSDLMDASTVLVGDGGHSSNYVRQAFRFKKGQRWVMATGLGLPGFAVPGAIGTTIARGNEPVVCLCEDRGLQLNIHELRTLLDYRLPVKTFVLKSQGHSVVRGIQRQFFGARFVGTDREPGPNEIPFLEVIRAIGIPVMVLSRADRMREDIRTALGTTGPIVCEVHVQNDYDLIPRQGFTIREDGKWVAKPLEDMYPFLDRATLRQQMVVNLLND